MNYIKPVLTEEQTNQLIMDKLIADVPFFVSRLGGVECDIISQIFLTGKVTGQTASMALNNAGIAPINYQNLLNFAVHFTDCVRNVDVMAVWDVTFYDFIVNVFCPQATFVPLTGIEPYYFPSKPWSKLLAHKRVLVIHPFEQSILNNFKHKNFLYEGTEVLPDFELITLKAEQNIGNIKSNYFQSLKIMQEKIKGLDFDIALIGCGAFGLPLGSFIKNYKNKSAIHLGGCLQILFGILGKRWDSKYPRISRFFNQYWTRPLESERPPTADLVEDACYW
jgi:hypothetical protein